MKIWDVEVSKWDMAKLAAIALGLVAWIVVVVTFGYDLAL